ncbi:type III secretion system effector PipB2 [Salmonella enterica]|uniref:Type III secretion system effector PipB2 n=1 Tax=Salmonella enterica TaxID=28901 RepID=A0A744KWL1_SALER|nr:type III secretion system effector PipB2 [Salmonella enterica]EBX4203369.1 type III secretion system effector PipB2 [Salmonella enterica subsp. enterica serovar Oakland]EBI3716684.1 type III secretion system effector PipB2 [Salmonella enterica]EBY7884857.1 type III secretion system effector PipB2 [Salmonella enterica subsp. enterica serovar Oakland]EDW8800194.1 type III secretion system effector PipB2 [Salmonella enterica subsp. enterica serovar Oakland]EDX5551169.1 type III secretion syste
MERSLDSLAGMAKSAFGAGTSAAMRQATSPKTILECIINFFTCGGVRRKNETQYQELVENMADTLRRTMPGRGAPLPENIILEDVDGCRVEFNLPGENNEARQVIVRVSKGDHSETREIPLASFEKVCRALLFRCEFSLPQDSVMLTAQGGMNLKGAVLTGANLTAENLCGADLSGADLEGAMLFMADCEGANLKGANLSGASLGYVNLTNACLEDSIMCGATLDSANLTGANLQHASLLGCSMIECNCSGANMDHANISGATLIRADMSGATLQGATIMAAIMEGAVLTRANLRKASFISTNLDGADLAEANLNNTCFKDCTLTHLRTEDARMSTSTQTLFNEFYSENI